MIPKDPMILLSYVNTQLRDYYDSLEALCTCRGLNRESLLDKMDSIDYHYDEETHQFIGDHHLQSVNTACQSCENRVAGGLFL